MKKIAGSFRDPSGRVFSADGRIFRSIMKNYEEHWMHATQSGLLDALLAHRKIVTFSEAEPRDDAWKFLEVEVVPWVSYPYEWSFFQLKDAALLTLDIQKEALKREMALKDASSFNVQFIGSRPVFIDLLSFERREASAPWQAYRQFCMHFLAPLALYNQDPHLSRLSTLWIDGIPLDVAWSMLRAKSFFSPGLQMHLHLHAKAEKAYGDGRASAEKVKKAHVSTQGLLDLSDSLRRTISSLAGPKEPGEWTDYYEDTNYSDAAEEAKKQMVAEIAGGVQGAVALDLGANTGKYSAILAEHFSHVIAADIDAQAVGKHYLALRSAGNQRILPLVLDLANPSPAIGWACSERNSWMQRGPADLICALALTHHLFFTNRIPWEEQAAFFASLLRTGGCLVMEFVPQEDSQVVRLLAARDCIFEDYTLESARKVFGVLFREEKILPLPGSRRTMLVLTKK